MSPPLAIRAGVVWTATDAAPDDGLVAALPAAIRARAERIERPGALALGAAGRLLPPAGAGEIRRDVGVVIGTAFGCLATNAAYQRRLAAQGAPGASPRLFAATVSNAAAGEVGIAYGLGGPAVTVTAGAAGGLAALDAARAEIDAGGVRGMLVAALDVVDAAGRRWLAEAGWPAGTPSEQVAALVLGDGPGPLPEVGRLGPVALGRTGGVGGPGIRSTVARALAAAGLAAADVRMRVTRRGDAVAVRAALGGAAVVEEPAHEWPLLLAAAGLAGVLEAVAGTGTPALVVDLCPSGHVAAVVAWSAAR